MRRAFICIILIQALMLTACAADPYEGLPVYDSGQALWAYWANDLGELESHSDIIVEGKLSNPQTIPPLEVGGFGSTAYTFTISAVHLGDVAPGDKISVVEYYYVREVDGEKSLQVFEGYMPSSMSETYLFFLSLQDENENSRHYGMYMPVCGVMGRHSLSAGSDMNNRAAKLKLGKNAPQDYYAVHDEVLAEYGK